MSTTLDDPPECDHLRRDEFDNTIGTWMRFSDSHDAFICMRCGKRDNAQ